MPPSTSLPDLGQFVDVQALQPGGCLHGRYGDEEVILVREGEVVHALGAHCPHAGAPLHKGRIAGGKVLCPFHHAAFDLQTGEALTPPALSPLPTYTVERQGQRARLKGRKQPTPPAPLHGATVPSSLTIVGGGAAGDAAAEMARRRGFAGDIHLFCAAERPPKDRTQLSKGFLQSGTEPDRLALHPASYWQEQRIDLRLGQAVVKVEASKKQILLQNGERHAYDKLLLAPGGAPRRPSLPGADKAHVLRSLQDCLALQQACVAAARVVVVGGGFVGLEAAAALRRRGCEVSVVAPTPLPLQNVLGEAAARVLFDMHRAQGVSFHMEQQVTAILKDGVQLDSGTHLAADVVLLAVGIEPRLELARSAGLRLHDGVVVDARMRSSHPDIYAAGDVARFCADYSGEWMRIEHWAVAQRQGQVAALAMIGQPQPFCDVPFFWTRHYDTSLAYVGHAAGFDAATVYGDLTAKAGAVVYRKGGKILAVATLGWQAQSLACHDALSRKAFAAVEEVLRA